VGASTHVTQYVGTKLLFVLHAWEYCNDYLTVEGQNLPKETAAWYGQYAACTTQDQDHFISKSGGQQAAFPVSGLQIYPRLHVCY
jgi:hypothetical protein